MDFRAHFTNIRPPTGFQSRHKNSWTWTEHWISFSSPNPSRVQPGNEGDKSFPPFWFVDLPAMYTSPIRQNQNANYTPSVARWSEDYPLLDGHWAWRTLKRSILGSTSKNLSIACLRCSRLGNLNGKELNSRKQQNFTTAMFLTIRIFNEGRLPRVSSWVI